MTGMGFQIMLWLPNRLFPCYHFPLNKPESRVYYVSFVSTGLQEHTVSRWGFLYFQHPTSSCPPKKKKNKKLFSTLVSHTLCLRKLNYRLYHPHSFPLWLPMGSCHWGAIGNRSDNRETHFPHLLPLCFVVVSPSLASSCLFYRRGCISSLAWSALRSFSIPSLYPCS